MAKITWLLLLLGITPPVHHAENIMQGKVILAIFAHPDDETSIAQLLVKYARHNKVYLIVATDGRHGTRQGFPAGDSLVKIRRAECECAAKITGIQPPVFFDFLDGFDTRIGVGIYLEQSKQLKAQITQKIREFNPAVILTFGPDGDTGHSDHRMISNMTTEIILKEGWVEKYPLYYLGWTKKDDEKFKMIGGLNTVDPKYLNVAIQYTEEDEQQALRSLECYKSQLSAQDIADWISVEKKDSSNKFYFRQLTVPSKQVTDF